MAQSDVSPSATAESKIDTLKAVFPGCLQLPDGDGGGFHVARGKQGTSWNPATSRPGTCRGGAFACWHSAWPSAFSKPDDDTGTSRGEMPFSDAQDFSVGDDFREAIIRWKPCRASGILETYEML